MEFRVAKAVCLFNLACFLLVGRFDVAAVCGMLLTIACGLDERLSPPKG